MKYFGFEELVTSDLHVDALYRGGRRGNAGDDPLGPLLRVSNSGGFRYRGNMDRFSLIVLTTSMSDHDWPDSIDRETGVFTYYGDNKVAGQKLHATPRRGNELLRRVFADSHSGAEGRRRVPPILVFSTAHAFRDVQFLGLVVPGTPGLTKTEDLVAVWHDGGAGRYQNYRARFSVLNAAVLSRAWLADIIEGRDPSDNAPPAWKLWVETGQYDALKSDRSRPWRNKNEQLPASEDGRAVLAAIHGHFSGRPHAFEHCAARLAELLLPNAHNIDVTRPSRDGGRDALGKLKIGRLGSSIDVDFALEAKCYGPGNSVGVREISRLISRLRHRQFGILVTTGYVDQQAYKEIKEDEHPILVLSGGDIVDLLKASGHSSPAQVSHWLETEFPEGEEWS